MGWILIGVIAGSIVTSGHDSREACLGRKAILDEQKIPAKCVEAPGHPFTSGVILNPAWSVTPGTVEQPR
jgi:hypothetical protein